VEGRIKDANILAVEGNTLAVEGLHTEEGIPEGAGAQAAEGESEAEDKGMATTRVCTTGSVS